MLAVEGERVLIPQMRAQPRRSAGGSPYGAFPRSGEAPGIGDDMRHPTARVVILLGRLAPRLYQRGDELVQRLLQFRQVANQGGPVVHLHIDVQVPVAVPWRLDFLGPDALQIRRQAAGAGGTDQEIPAEVEIERGQGGIRVPLGKARQARIGGQGAVRSRWQVKLDPVEPFLVVRPLRGPQILEGFGRRLIEIRRRRRERVAQLPASKPPVVGGRGEKQDHLLGIGDHEIVALRLHRSPARHHAQTPGIGDAFSAAPVVQRASHQQFIVVHRRRLETLGAIQR